jgi:hypothetical protein
MCFDFSPIFTYNLAHGISGTAIRDASCINMLIEMKKTPYQVTNC